MRDLVIDNSLDLIRKYNPNYNDEKMAEIKYGLIGLYLTITKTIVIFIVALFLNLFKELLILTIFYNIIRIPSFGMHASKSWICWIASSLMFLGGAYLCLILDISINIKVILSIIGTVLIFKNSPADTKKRPIINSKRRMTYKIVSLIVALIFTILIIFLNNNLIVNCLLFSLIYQAIITAPTTYKIFNQPYDNYKNYIKV